MSSTMGISVPNPADVKISDQNGNGFAQPLASPSPTAPHYKFLVSVEVCLKASSTARPDDVRKAVEQMLEKRSLSYVDGPVTVPIDDPFLMENVQRIYICDTDKWVKNHDILLFWQVKPVVHVFQDVDAVFAWLAEIEQCVTNSSLPCCIILDFPMTDCREGNFLKLSKMKQGFLWSIALFFYMDPQGQERHLYVKRRHKNYPLVSASGTPSANWLKLMHILCLVNGSLRAASWSQSFFKKIQEMVEEENNLVFVLIDEVESLAAARKAEPSVSIRMDKLKSSPNVIILTTSNITAAIDIAFVDRADIKAYVGPPTLQACYEILRSCLHELIRTGIISIIQGSSQSILPDYVTSKEKLNMHEIQEVQPTLHLCKQLLEAAEAWIEWKVIKKTSIFGACGSQQPLLL
ncbi:hypothetical protein CRYUN_Cryun07bG0002500 [Craigia yunnanensis]